MTYTYNYLHFQRKGRNLCEFYKGPIRKYANILHTSNTKHSAFRHDDIIICGDWN